MEKKKPLSWTALVLLVLGVFLFSGGIFMNISSSFAAGQALEAKKVVETSRLTLEGFTQILIRGRVNNPLSKGLVEAVTKASGEN